MASFRTRIRGASRQNGRIILANDYGASVRDLKSRTLRNIRILGGHLCAIKLNFHLLLPLGSGDISRITRTAHDYGLQVIADIKLNDIGSTNEAAAERLWSLGFDAVIANPVMGADSLGRLVSHAHKAGNGVIALCHMSAPEARRVYDMTVLPGGKKTSLYRLFFDWAVSHRADGVIAGATFPDVIRFCRSAPGRRPEIYSPGVGTQGGSAAGAIAAGSDYLIVGRTILGSGDPVATAADLKLRASG